MWKFFTAPPAVTRCSVDSCSKNLNFSLSQFLNLVPLLSVPVTNLKMIVLLTHFEAALMCARWALFDGSTPGVRSSMLVDNDAWPVSTI